MAKRIEIPSGISHEPTIKIYALAMEKYFEKFDDHYPEIVLFSLGFQNLTGFEEQNKMVG